MRTIVLDTSVLLADPQALFAYPGSNLVIPEPVLGELDKLKTSRVDPDLRFRGRVVSRHIFELSEGGSLTEGVPLPEGGTLRVMSLPADAVLPEGLSPRNTDDRILAVASLACREECDGITLVTNDLNMLLKAQSIDLEVDRYGDGTDDTPVKKYLLRPVQRYRIPISILAISLAVFVAVLLLAIYGSRLIAPQPQAGVPEEFLQLLTAEQRTVLEDLQILSTNPDNPQALLDMANFYYALRESTGDPRWGRLAIRYYVDYLEMTPDDVTARTELAVMYFLLGQTDRAIQEVSLGLEVEPSHISANFHLGLFFWQGRKDFAGAEAQLLRVMELTDAAPSSPDHALRQQASTALDQLRQEAEAAGAPLPEVTTEGATF